MSRAVLVINTALDTVAVARALSRAAAKVDEAVKDLGRVEFAARRIAADFVRSGDIAASTRFVYDAVFHPAVVEMVRELRRQVDRKAAKRKRQARQRTGRR